MWLPSSENRWPLSRFGNLGSPAVESGSVRIQTLVLQLAAGTGSFTRRIDVTIR